MREKGGLPNAFTDQRATNTCRSSYVEINDQLRRAKTDQYLTRSTAHNCRVSSQWDCWHSISNLHSKTFRFHKYASLATVERQYGTQWRGIVRFSLSETSTQSHTSTTSTIPNTSKSWGKQSHRISQHIRSRARPCKYCHRHFVNIWTLTFILLAFISL